MFRGLIAIVVAFAIALSSFAKPSYAMPVESAMEAASTVIIQQGDNNFAQINPPAIEPISTSEPTAADEFWQGVQKGVVETSGAIVGGVIVCYALDGLATMIFPPAAAASAFFPTVGGLKGTTAIMKMGS